MPGYINVDLEMKEGVDIAVDLNQLPWPWDDASVDELFAQDCLEHLSPLGRANGQANIIAVMAEIHRILKPDGKVEIIVPSTDGPGAFQDPTHVTYWNRNSFIYFLESNDKFGGGWAQDGFPKFHIRGDSLGIGDTMPSDLGIIWSVARMRKSNGTESSEQSSSN